MTNNNTNKVNTMKFYNVLAISPITGRETTFREVPASQLRVNEHGETLFRYNDFYNTVEVITATLATDTAAKAAYMEKWGTASE